MRKISTLLSIFLLWTAAAASLDIEDKLIELNKRIKKRGLEMSLRIAGGEQSQEALEKEVKLLIIQEVFMDQEAISDAEIDRICSIKIIGTSNKLFDENTKQEVTAINQKLNDEDPGTILVNWERWGRTKLYARYKLMGQHEFAGLSGQDRNYELSAEPGIRDFLSAHTTPLFDKDITHTDVVANVCYMPLLKTIAIALASQWKNCGASKPSKSFPSVDKINKYLDRLITAVPYNGTKVQTYNFEIEYKSYPKKTMLADFLKALAPTFRPIEFACTKTFSPEEVTQLISSKIIQRDNASPYCNWGRNTAGARK